jgi:hypothetical protein
MMTLCAFQRARQHLLALLGPQAASGPRHPLRAAGNRPTADQRRNLDGAVDPCLPTGPGYANNAADLVEFRVKPTSGATAFRVILNTLENPSLIAFSSALGGHGGQTVRIAMGVGLWDAANGRYLLPQATADATHPGGAGTATNPAAFFNVAFRTAEPEPSVTAETGAVTDPAWWRDQQQGTALAAGDISAFSAEVNFREARRGCHRQFAGPGQRHDGPNPGQSLLARAGRRLLG